MKIESTHKTRKRERRKRNEEKKIEKLKEDLYEKYLRKEKHKLKKRNTRRENSLIQDARIEQLKKDEKIIEHPRFSLVAAAIRKDMYDKVYWNLRGNNNVPFEMIFAGYSPPDNDVSVNFKYLNVDYSVVKCVELAARNSRADYIIITTDDCLFTPAFLDILDIYLNKYWFNKKVMFGIGQKKMKNDKIVNLNTDFIDTDSPIISEFSVFERKTWIRLGGLDRRFDGAYFNYDLIFRFYEDGYTLHTIPYFFGLELDIEHKTKLYTRTKIQGINLMKQLWSKNDKFSCERLEPVDSFKDEDFLIG